MSDETKAEKASREAKNKVQELWKIWVEQYPDNIDQTYYHLVISHIEILKTLLRLSAGVIE